MVAGVGILYACGTQQTGNVAKTETSTTSNPSQISTKNNLAEGKSLFENSCAKCHDLPDPKKFTGDQWKMVVNSMKGKAHLSEEQADLVYQYGISQQH